MSLQCLYTLFHVTPPLLFTTLLTLTFLFSPLYFAPKSSFGRPFALAPGNAAAADFEPLLELRLLPVRGWASPWHYTALTCFLSFAKPRNTEQTLSEPARFTFHLVYASRKFNALAMIAKAA